MRALSTTLAALFVVVAPLPAHAQQPLDPAISTMTAPKSAPVPPLNHAQMALIQPLATLPTAPSSAPAEIEEIVRWNTSGRTPTKTGFLRRLPQPLAVSSDETPSGGLIKVPRRDSGEHVWAFSLAVADAHRLRLHLTNVVLPDGATLWINGKDEEAIAFGAELLGASGEIWTPSTSGDVVYLQVAAPDSSRLSFTVPDIIEILGPALARYEAAMSYACLQDASCVTTATFDQIDAARSAVADLEFVSGGSTYICTGTLLNDRQGSFKPYLLTAHHCFSSQTEATSLEAFWDFKTPYCGGPAPSLSSLPRTNGATLLATGADSDYTFVQLAASPPGSRYYLGWDPRPSSITNGITLYRVSHPHPVAADPPQPQRFSESLVDVSTQACAGWSRPLHIYSSRWLGGVYGGSSGAAAMLSGGYVVGQLHGGCGGADPGNGCDNFVAQADGAFSNTYQALVPWLEAGTIASPVASFAFTPRTPKTGELVQFTDTSTGPPTAWSWDFHDGTTSNRQNPFRTYSAAGTYQVSLTASNSAGSSTTTGSITVVNGCAPSSTTLCLSGSRFAVSAIWEKPDATSGQATAIPLADDTGAFWFFSATNYEMMLKTLDACSINGHKWVFAGGLTNVKVTVSVTDTKTGAARSYVNPQGHAFAPVQDTNAFSTCP